jgi:DHA1 family inner membrane transport protein
MLFPILLLSAAGFTVLTTEFIIVGLLPSIARDLDVSVSQAGLLVTLFAFTVAAFGPFLTAYFARFERKRLFITILIMFGLANTLAAVASNIWVMSLARLIPALGLPVFWALASETAVDIVGPDFAGRAIEKIGFGIVCATVFGIPVGTLISDMFGWRTAFGILAVVAFAKALLLFIYLPKTRAKNDQVSLRSQFKILRSPLMQGHILLSILVFSGMFTAYTYLADILERLAGFDGTLVGWCLMGFGAVGLIGNSLGGRMVDRHPLIASMVFCGFMIAGMVALVPAIHSTIGLAAAMAVWGVTQEHRRGQPGDWPGGVGGRSRDRHPGPWQPRVCCGWLYPAVDPAGAVADDRQDPRRLRLIPQGRAVNSSRLAPSVIATMPGCLTLRSTEIA